MSEKRSIWKILAEDSLIPWVREPLIPCFSGSGKINPGYLAMRFIQMLSSTFTQYPSPETDFQSSNYEPAIYSPTAGTTVTAHPFFNTDNWGYAYQTTIEIERPNNNFSIADIVWGDGIFLWYSKGWTVAVGPSSIPGDLILSKSFYLRNHRIIEVRWDMFGYLATVQFKMVPDHDLEEFYEFRFDHGGIVTNVIPSWLVAEITTTEWFIKRREPQILRRYNDFPETLRQLAPQRIDPRWVIVKVRKSLPKRQRRR